LVVKVLEPLEDRVALMDFGEFFSIPEVPLGYSVG
jgi:hypothetical protein